MIAALIGFIGVVVGALLTGWLSQRAERERRYRAAVAAAEQIVAELEIASTKLASASSEGEWWPGDLPSEQWSVGRNAMAAGGVGADLRGELSSAYALIELWDGEKRAAARASAFPAHLGTEWSKNQGKFEYLIERLGTAVPEPSPGHTEKQILRAMAAAAVLATLALGFAAFVPRAETTDASISAALERALPGPETVACSHNADRWLCNVGYQSHAGGGCQVARPSLHATSVLVDRPNVGGSCHPSNADPRPNEFKIKTGDDGLVAFARANRTYGKTLSDKIKERPKEVEVKKESWFTRTFGIP